MTKEGFTVWLTGMTGSGKSTLARLLHQRLDTRGFHCEVLDSGRIRQALNRSLGFSREEVETNLLRIGYECKLLNRNGIVAIVAAVSPYRDVRERIKADVERLVEVYCRCPLDVLLQRDTADLLARARRGEVKHVAGINAPYEEPIKPAVTVNTDVDRPETCVDGIVSVLERLGYLPSRPSARYTEDEETIIKERFRDLGYS